MRFRFLALAVLALGIASSAYAAIGTLGGRVATVTPPPSNANIPVVSLINGGYPANTWSGWTTAATTASGAGTTHVLQTTTSPSTSYMAVTTSDWRDTEVTMGYSGTSRIALRSTGAAGTALQMAVNIGGSGLRMGYITGVDLTDPTAGTPTHTYTQASPASCIANWPTDNTHTITFGARGFEVYLLIDGAPAYDTCQTTAMNPLGELRWYDYRTQATNTGKAMVWCQSGCGNQVTATYYSLTALNSNIATNTFDITDFGVRQVSAVTGSMSANSCTLTLNSPRDIRVRDKIIVEVGGEAGAGAINTIGVGGSSPELHYANAAARDADTTQSVNTYAYIDTDGTVKRWDGSAWVVNPQNNSPTATGMQTYYAKWKAPVALRASVVAVNASPATVLTLKTFGADFKTNCSTVATTNANVWLDSRYGLYPLAITPAENFNSSAQDSYVYSNMTVNVPTGTWYVGGPSNVTTANSSIRPGFTFKGQGIASTFFRSPFGTPSALSDGGSTNNGLTYQDFTYTGNLSNYGGTMWNYTGTNKNFGDGTLGGPITISSRASSNNVTAQRVKCIDMVRGCVVFGGGYNMQILNSELVATIGQYSYFQWMFMLESCNPTVASRMDGIVSTGAYLFKSIELFACSGATINNVSGTNVLFSTNSSSNTTISNIDVTITQDAFFDITSGWVDEGVFNINVNAFGSGNTGTLSNWRIVQNGFVRTSDKTSLIAIKIQPTQTDWTISGGYPGGGGCSTALGGFNQAPDYDGSLSTPEYGAMAVLSDAARTTVTGIRAKGAAIGTPGHSSHYGNISLNGANSVATNNVADVIHMGGSSPTTSGNQTNAAYGGC